jgi:hypothetical protein
MIARDTAHEPVFLRAFMKKFAFFVPAFLCVIASPAATAADFFGRPTGPGLGALPSAPTSAEPTPAPKKADPAPAKTGMSPAPVAPLAPLTPLPTSLQALGPLQNHLKAWFSFNSRDQGGIAWSAEALGAVLSPAAVLRDVAGQRIADLGLDGAVLTFAPSATLGERYTIAAWVAFPVRSKSAVIFYGSRGELLNVQASGAFGCAVGTQNFTFGSALAPQSGWHHVALSVDGKQSTLLVDGRVQGQVAAAAADSLTAVGNHPAVYQQSRMMSAPMDDVAIFNRELTDVEVVKLASVHAATTTAGDTLASTQTAQTGQTGQTAPAAPPAPLTIPSSQPFKSSLDAPPPQPKVEKPDPDEERGWGRRGPGGGGFGRGRGR